MNRKAVTPIITALMFLIMVGSTYFAMERWYYNYASELQAKNEARSETSKIGLLDLITYGDSSYAVLGVKNYGQYLHEIDKVKINGNECALLSTNVIESVNPVYLNCSVTIGQSYEVELYTNQGIFSRAFTVTE